jgi:hypothetical protein
MALNMNISHWLSPEPTQVALPCGNTPRSKNQTRISYAPMLIPCLHHRAPCSQPNKQGSPRASPRANPRSIHGASSTRCTPPPRTIAKKFPHLAVRRILENRFVPSTFGPADVVPRVLVNRWAVTILLALLVPSFGDKVKGLAGQYNVSGKSIEII